MARDSRGLVPHGPFRNGFRPDSEVSYGRIGSDLRNGQIAIVIRIDSYGIFSTLLAFIAGIRIVVEDLKLVYASETSFDHRTPQQASDAAAPAFVRRQSRAVATLNHPGPMPIR